MSDFRAAFAERYGVRWPEPGDRLPDELQRRTGAQNAIPLVFEMVADMMDDLVARLAVAERTGRELDSSDS